MHREGLAIAGVFIKASFLGETSYQFCGHLSQRRTEKNNGKIVNYGKQYFTGFIIFRIRGISLRMGGNTAQSHGNAGAGGNAVLHAGAHE